MTAADIIASAKIERFAEDDSFAPGETMITLDWICTGTTEPAEAREQWAFHFADQHKVDRAEMVAALESALAA